MNESGNSLENRSLNIFDDSEVVLEECESSLTHEPGGTAEIPKIQQVVRGTGRRSKVIVYFEMDGLYFAGNIDKERVKGVG